MDVREEQLNEEELNRHWYFQSKARYLQRAIGEVAPHCILDVGAGSGFFSHWLLRHTAASQAICVDTGYTNDREETIAGKSLQYRTQVAEASVDLVLLMDVLEHVEDDVALLSHYVKIVPPGTRFLLTVPAFAFLWSSHDVFLQHKRRYTLKSLSEVVAAAGLQIESRHYCFGFVFPIVCVTRCLDRYFVRETDVVKSTLKKHSLPVNLFLKVLCLLELPIVQLNKVAGLSVMCRCKKQGPADRSLGSISSPGARAS